MTARHLAALTRVNLARDLRGAIFAAFGVAFGVGSLAFFVALGGGASGAVSRLFPAELASVEVVPPQVSLATALGGGRLDDDALARLAALPGVARAWPKMEIRVPAMGSPSDNLVEQFHVPRHIYVALIAVGVEAAFVEKDLPPGIVFEDPGEGRPAPALAARRLLELYNKSFAPAQRLRPIGEEAVRTAAGLEMLAMTLGRSMRGPTGMPERRLGLAFGGFSDRAPLHGVLVPLALARRVNRDYGQEASLYSAATLTITDAASVPRVAAAVRAMGLAVDDSARSAAEKIGLGVALVTVALGLFAGLIVLLAAVNIAHALSASVRARSRELGVLRAVGATRRDVAALVLAEAAVIGACGGAVGGLAARLAAMAVDAAVARALPDFPFKPDTLFRFPLWVGATAVLVGIAAAVAGAYGPARKAARMDPARAIAG